MIKQKNRGSLTVEASLILPVIMSVFLFFLCFFQVFLIQEKIEIGLWETAKEISQYGHIYQSKEEAKKDSETGKSGRQVAETYVAGLLTSERMETYIADDFLDHSCVKNGANGVVYTTEAFQEDAKILLTASYEVTIPMFCFIIPDIHIVQQVESRGFVGTSKIGLEEGDEDDCIVYLSANGEKSRVYHMAITCTHLNLSIQSARFSDIPNLRNVYGGKYKACEKCIKQNTLSDGSTVYIATDGNCYHSSLDCSGITRNVREVRLSTLSGYRPCSRCGGS